MQMQVRSLRHAAMALALAAAAALAGCGPVRFETGTPFDPAQLGTSLQPGRATTADVRAALGAPDGMGAAMMPFHDRRRLTWTYFRDEGTIDLSAGTVNDRLGYLFVFFLDDRLDSWIWLQTDGKPSR